MNKMIIVSSVSSVVIVIAVVSLYLFSPSSQSNIEQQVTSFYQLVNPGITAQVVAADEQSGMYHMILKLIGLQSTNYAEVWVTKDGKFLTSSPVLLQQSVANLQGLKNFVDCLNTKGVRIYGISNQTATLLQLNILGTFSPKLFFACDSNLQACVNAGIQQVPTVVYGNQSYPGVENINWFANITGCQLS
jgi:hypothetical protein